MKYIQSSSNPQFKTYKKLLTKKERDKSGLFLVEGFHLVEEAKNFGYVKEYIVNDSTGVPEEWNVDDNQIRLITDSNYVLTGIYSSFNFCDEHEACLYSDQQNLVDVMKEALKNKIILLENVNSSLDN